MDGWRLVIGGHTVDLCEGPPGYFTPIVDWRTHFTPLPGASCADLRAAIAHAWPLVATIIESPAPGAATPAPTAGTGR